MRYCPGFLIDAASSLSAKAFLENHFTLEQCCARTFEHLSQNYDDNFADLAVNIADFKLRILAEADIEDADGLLMRHIYGLLHYKKDLSIRSWNSIFRDPLKSQKTAATEDDLVNLLKMIDPDIRIVGADWRGKDFTGSELPIKIFFNSRNHSYSTSHLRERVYDAELKKRSQP